MFLFPRTLGELQKWSEAIEKQRRWAWKRKQNWTHALTFACFPFSFLPLQLSPMLLLHLPACIPQSTFKPHSFCSSPSVYLSVPQHTFIPSPVAFPQAMSAQLSVPQRTFHSPHFPGSLPPLLFCTQQPQPRYNHPWRILFSCWFPPIETTQWKPKH